MRSYDTEERRAKNSWSSLSVSIVQCRKMLSNKPTATMFSTKLDPPKLMKGSGSPFVGNHAVTTPTLIRACIAISRAMPMPRYWPKRSDARSAIMTAQATKSAKASRIPMVPTNPNSSPTMGKIKSV